MRRLATKFATALALGPVNLGRVAAYRIGLKTGLGSVTRLRADAPKGPFFASLPPSGPWPTPVPTWRTEGRMFSALPFSVGAAPPDWNTHPVNGRRVAGAERSWNFIPDYPESGDIKGYWELSRMDWILAFAEQARAGDPQALDRLNAWLENWSLVNAPYRGPNWKCGQEASIRVMHLAMAAVILDQVETPTSALISLIEAHLQRIAPTIHYAVAQDNNHGTSEAAALFIGGAWLARQGVLRGAAWEACGRHWLEERITRLFGADGGFSQYSLNYHRVALDTLSIAEIWRRRLDLPAFSTAWHQRAQAASRWLFGMVNLVNGDGPNLGANDGARLLQITDSGYRDYRPSIQLATALFCRKSAFGPGPWDDALVWMGVDAPVVQAAPAASHVSDDTGTAVLRSGPMMAMLRYPRFRFRPSQADALHLDLWRGGENLLRDGGTYSYNDGAEWLTYFGGTASHNTVQFDGRDQMPRLGRFLFGDWLKTSRVDPLVIELGGRASFGAAYRDGQGAAHHRSVALDSGGVRVIDQISGFARKAVLRWRLAPDDWRIEGDSVTNGRDGLTVTASMAIARREIVEGWESRHYAEKTRLPVLEIEVNDPGTLETKYRGQ